MFIPRKCNGTDKADHANTEFCREVDYIQIVESIARYYIEYGPDTDEEFAEPAFHIFENRRLAALVNRQAISLLAK